ncbi:MAG: DUF5658 family protein [Natronomonas sp.]
MSTNSDTPQSRARRTLSDPEERFPAIGGWRRYNRSIRFYGVILLSGTKLADAITTAVGLQYFPAIAETNPVADHLFVEWGLLTGLTVLGFTSVLFAVCAAELLGLEVQRRFELPKTALFAQASIYLTLSVLFGLVAVQNGLLIADQTVYMLDDTLLSPPVIGG